MSDSPQRIVVLAPNWLGDAVMALPAISDVRLHFAGATLAVAAREGLAPLFQSVGGIDEVVALRSGSSRTRERVAAYAQTLTQGRYDLAVLLPNSYFSASVVARSGISERWGYRTDWRGWLLTRSVPRPRGRMHQASYYRELMTRLGIPSGPLTPTLSAPESAVRDAETLLAEGGIPAGARFVAMAPGAANGAAKQWPPARFAELVRALGERHAARVVLLGSGADASAGLEMEQALSQHPNHRATCLNLIGRTDIPLLMGVLARCAVLVTNDSGAMHLASALGRRVVAIFGATDERATSPIEWDGIGGSHDIVSSDVWCRPCLLHECPIDHRCMTSILASDVAVRVEHQWSAAGQARVS